MCYDDYDRNIEDTSDFDPGYRKYTSADAWRYQTVKELGGSDHEGLLATYRWGLAFFLVSIFLKLQYFINKYWISVVQDQYKLCLSKKMWLNLF